MVVVVLVVLWSETSRTAGDIAEGGRNDTNQAWGPDDRV